MDEERDDGDRRGNRGWQGKGATKQLQSAVEATAYQKRWFQEIKQRVAKGEPCVLIGAGNMEEILLTMDIPYIVLMWWSAVVSSRQAAPQLLSHLEARGYRNAFAYTALPFASTLEPDQEKVPWGGLPKISLILGGGDKVTSLWAKEHGIPIFPVHQTTLIDAEPTNWWDRCRYGWEELYHSYRLDLMVEDIKAFIRYLEVTTGRVFSETKFKRIMDMANEQEEYCRMTRDLIAETVPAPISIADSIPSTMIPQWHRGTEWGLNAARMFYEEVKAKVERGEAPCENEKIRLMWIGTGLWYNMSFYQYFQEKYDAVFIWSIYLGIAADGYVRYGDDPVRCLASRFVSLTEGLNVPPWNAAWYVNEARRNKIDAVVEFGGHGRARGGYFIKKALEDAGFPVFEIKSDTVDSRTWNDEEIKRQFSEFLETRVL